MANKMELLKNKKYLWLILFVVLLALLFLVLLEVSHINYTNKVTNKNPVVLNAPTTTPTTIPTVPNAAFVLGQTNFTSSTTATTQSGMRYPSGVSYDPVNKRLFVADGDNNRVLVFNVAPSTITNGEKASFVLGQPNFDTAAYTIASSRMSPSGVSYDSTNQRLFVTDSGGHRTLVFNVAPSTITNGEKASFVLGQPNFTTSNSVTPRSGISPADGLWHPMILSYDSINQRLFVGTPENSRILTYNVAPATITNGERASFVLGQPSFDTFISTTTQNGMEYPLGVSYDSTNQRLFVADGGNNRVTVFHFVKMVSTLPVGTVGSVYNAPVLASPAQGTTTLAVVGGALPHGLTLGTTTIKGTPTVAGTYTFTLQAINNYGATGSIKSNPAHLSITIR